MNHHTRSYSEQPLIGGGSQIINGLAQQPQPQARILNHSDSQQSLDRLFNPTMTSSVPLRDRNLPSSFFNPTVITDNGSIGTPATNGNHALGNNLHSRSISFDQRNSNIAQPRRHNLHTRTHSTLAPMPQLDSNHSSHHTSREFLNTTNSNGNGNNVSTCLLHGDNIVSSTSANNQHHHHQQSHPNQHSHSNGWSNTRNSIDDSSSSSWASSPQEAPMMVHQPMQVVQHHQPTIMHESAVQIQTSQQQPTTTQHQPMFYNTATQHTIASVDTTVRPMVATSAVCQSHPLHNRSVSYQQRPVVADIHANHGFHMRTHSTVAPMPSTCLHHHHQHQLQQATSHQSSQEMLNHSSATISSAAAGGGWSSSGYSTDDMTSAGAGHGWNQGNQLHQNRHPSLSQLPTTQQPLPQPTIMDQHQQQQHPPMQAQQQQLHFF